MNLNWVQILVIALLLIALVWGLAGCSSLTDRHDTDFEIDVRAKNCDEIVIEGYRGEAKKQENIEQGTNIKFIK